LLFRANGFENEFDGSDPASATAEVLANSLLAIGLENLVGGKLAFVNFDRELLLKEWHAVLPPTGSVIEILEPWSLMLRWSPPAVNFASRGTRLRLTISSLTTATSIICSALRTSSKSRSAALPGPSRRHSFISCHARGLEMLAEKVETYEEFAWARKASYDYFQGFFFARPAIVRAKLIPVAKSNCLRLFREMTRPELDLERLDRVIGADVALAYKLLR